MNKLGVKISIFFAIVLAGIAAAYVFSQVNSSDTVATDTNAPTLSEAETNEPRLGTTLGTQPQTTNNSESEASPIETAAAETTPAPETIESTPTPTQANKQLLVYYGVSTDRGTFQHDNSEAGTESPAGRAVIKIAEANNIETFFTTDPSIFGSANIETYDAALFLNNDGRLFVTEQQRSDFQNLSLIHI